MSVILPWISAAVLASLPLQKKKSKYLKSVTNVAQIWQELKDLNTMGFKEILESSLGNKGFHHLIRLRVVFCQGILKIWENWKSFCWFGRILEYYGYSGRKGLVIFNQNSMILKKYCSFILNTALRSSIFLTKKRSPEEILISFIKLWA